MFSKFLNLMLAWVLIMCLVGCSEKEIKEEIVGTYVGDEGDCITLFEDGTAEYYYYTWGDYVDTSSTWNLKKNRVTIYIAEFKYDVYTDIDADTTSTIVLKSNSTKWEDEKFKKLTSSAMKHTPWEYTKMIEDELNWNLSEDYDDISGNST